MFEKAAKLSRKRIIRILVSFVVTFIAINICVYYSLPSYKTTLRASEMLLEANLCNFSDKDFDDIEDMIAGDSQRKIFVLGDSVSYGIGQEEEIATYSALLREILKEKNISVYNFSSCGSKPLDYYLWVRYLSELDSGDNVFVIQYNYKWFSADTKRLEDRISQKKILFRFNKYLSAEIREKLEYHPSYISNFSSFLDREIPIVSSRTKLFAFVFKEKSKEDFIEHLFYGKPEKQNMEYKTDIWSQKDELKSYNCKIEFGSELWDEDNFNYYVYLETLKLINENQGESMVFLPPYNSELIGKCEKSPGFQQNLERFVADAESLNISANFNTLFDEKYFLDEMHLNDEGQDVFSAIIYSILITNGL